MSLLKFWRQRDWFVMGGILRLFLLCLMCVFGSSAILLNIYNHRLSDFFHRSLTYKHKSISFEDALKKHRLPQDHPIRDELDIFFSQSHVTKNESTLMKAGFEILSRGLVSFTTIVRHPAFPGYIFKLYLEDQKKTKEEKSHNHWLAQRCVGAAKIRKLIRKKKIVHFSVPDKWLYELPLNEQLVIVVETDMQLVSEEQTKMAWKHANRDVLDELYVFLKRGYGSYGLTANVPYTKNGRFAFIDTEYPRREIPLKKVRKYFSDDMAEYWKKTRLKNT